MSQPTITMRFKLGKPVEITSSGVPGAGCKAFTKPFEDALGGNVLNDTPTAEMAQAPAEASAAQQVSAGGGQTF